MSLETLLQHLLTQRHAVSTTEQFSSVADCWASLQTLLPQWPDPIDRAIVGGFSADCIGYAFVAGYQMALRRLLPTLPDNKMVSLCVTEEKGNHPKVLESALTAVSNRLQLNGRKKWASLSGNSGLLLVAAVRGTRPDGQKEIVLVQVPTDAAGVSVKLMPPTPFVPEVTHGQIGLNDVGVEETAVLPGDGYTDYIKPFRTIEDCFVSAAVASLLLRIAFQNNWPNTIIQQILSLLTLFRAIGTADYHDPTIHIVLEGALITLGKLANTVGEGWQQMLQMGEEEKTAVVQRWQRDIPLLQIARTARQRRYERAWQQVAPVRYNKR